MNRVIHGLAALAFCAPFVANAAEGYVVADIGLQAGPDTDYPTITELSAGTPVAIQGCLQGWTWCDVIADRDRGWVPGTFLEEPYGGQRVVVIDYGARIGIPVVGFSIAAYWDRHYHDRPFYAQRQQFETRAIRPHAPPRPSGVAAARSGTQRGGTATATIAKPTQSTAQRNMQQATTAQQKRMATQEQPVSEERANQERAARQQRSTTSERVPQTAQRTDETRPAQQKHGANSTEQQRMAQQPRHEETPANQPAETPPPRNPNAQAQNPRGAVTAKNQPRQKPEPKSKDELSKPKKDDKDKDGGG